MVSVFGFFLKIIFEFALYALVRSSERSRKDRPSRKYKFCRVSLNKIASKCKKSLFLYCVDFCCISRSSNGLCVLVLIRSYSPCICSLWRRLLTAPFPHIAATSIPHLCAGLFTFWPKQAYRNSTVVMAHYVSIYMGKRRRVK